MAGNEHGHGKPGPQHETTDINVFAIGRFLVAMVLVIAVCVVLLFGMFRYYESITGGTKPVALEHGPTGKLPPQPRLEEKPITNLREFREAEEKALTTYGWVDQKSGVVRIPIDRAIDLMAQRGLSSRQQAGPQSEASGVSQPTESGLGIKAPQGESK